MINDNIKTVREYISGERAFCNTEGITQFHRVAASDGYRAAANYCIGLLEREGVRCELDRFPANEETKCWTQQMHQAWTCHDAKLELVTPCRLTLSDFKACNLSIVQYSAPCDFRDEPKELVMIEKGHREDYENRDLKGKLIFVEENPNGYVDWAYQKGVYGMVSDFMSDTTVRVRNDRYNDRLFASFLWMNKETDHKTFSFLLSPRLGDQLREICRSMEAEYAKDSSRPRYPTLTGFIDATVKDGEMENVVATIPGETDEEVLLLAHLCHAKGCANDNASGCGGSIEIMKALNDLISSGALPRPKRTIRMLLVPEVIGTFAYLANHEDTIPKIKAGIDIDMIGRRQEGESGMVGIMGVPDSTASFVLDLAAYILEENSRDKRTFNIDEYVTPVHAQILPYTGGSDHYILCDPTVGVPCIIMMQWLDSNYHSTADTIDQLDPKVLQKNCSIAASYLYTLADMQPDDVWFIMNKARERLAKLIAGIVKDAGIRKLGYTEFKEHIEYTTDVFLRAAEDYLRFFTGKELEAVKRKVENEKQVIREYSDMVLREYLMSGKAFADSKPENEEQYADEKYHAVPRRLFRGPITFMGFAECLSPELQEAYAALRSRYPEFYGMNSMNDFIIHRVDGTRDILQIARGAYLEGKLYNPDYVIDYLSFLEKAGLIAFQPSAK